MSIVFKIFSQSKYLILSILVSLSLVIFAIWLPNLHLITKTMTSVTLSFWQKTNLITSLLGSFDTNFTPLSRVITVSISALAGIQVSLLTYYLRQSITIQKEMGISFFGILASLLGVGCASCGSVILTTILGLGSTSIILGAFPLKGQEFSILGISILLLAIYLTVKKLNKPLIC